MQSPPKRIVLERGFNYSVPIKNLVAQEFLPPHPMVFTIQIIYRSCTVVKIIRTQHLQLSLPQTMVTVPAHTLTTLTPNDLAYFAIIMLLKRVLMPEGLLSVLQLTLWKDRS